MKTKTHTKHTKKFRQLLTSIKVYLADDGEVYRPVTQTLKVVVTGRADKLAFAHEWAPDGEAHDLIPRVVGASIVFFVLEASTLDVHHGRHRWEVQHQDILEVLFRFRICGQTNCDIPDRVMKALVPPSGNATADAKRELAMWSILVEGYQSLVASITDDIRDAVRQRDSIREVHEAVPMFNYHPARRLEPTIEHHAYRSGADVYHRAIINALGS